MLVSAADIGDSPVCSDRSPAGGGPLIRVFGDFDIAEDAFQEASSSSWSGGPTGLPPAPTVDHYDRPQQGHRRSDEIDAPRGHAQPRSSPPATT